MSCKSWLLALLTLAMVLCSASAFPGPENGDEALSRQKRCKLQDFDLKYGYLQLVTTIQYTMPFTVLGLFNVIQFANTGCNGTDDQRGVCYTSSECTSRGGRSSGSCAAGFGVCCVCKNLVPFLPVLLSYNPALQSNSRAIVNDQVQKK